MNQLLNIYSLHPPFLHFFWGRGRAWCRCGSHATAWSPSGGISGRLPKSPPGTTPQTELPEAISKRRPSLLGLAEAGQTCAAAGGCHLPLFCGRLVALPLAALPGKTGGAPVSSARLLPGLRPWPLLAPLSLQLSGMGVAKLAQNASGGPRGFLPAPHRLSLAGRLLPKPAEHQSHAVCHVCLQLLLQAQPHHRTSSAACPLPAGRDCQWTSSHGKTHKARPQTCPDRFGNLSGAVWVLALLHRQQQLLQLLPRLPLHSPLLRYSAHAVLGVPNLEWAHAPNLGWAAACPADEGGHPRLAAVPPLQKHLGGHVLPQHELRQQPIQPGFPAPPLHSRGLCRRQPVGQRRAVKSNDYIKKRFSYR